MIIFGSAPPVSIVIVNAVLELFSAPVSDIFVDAIRDECDQVLDAAEGVWSKGMVERLYRADSVIR